MASRALKLGIGGAAIVAAGALASRTLLVRKHVEGPEYEVTLRSGEVEIRRYGPRLVARTEVAGDFHEAQEAGFRRLAAFIFGENAPPPQPAGTAPEEAGRRIAMTTPVEQQPSGRIAMTTPVELQNEGAWVMTFTMPSEYTAETLPRPADAAITVEQAPARRVAAIRFAGRATPERIREETDAMLAELRALGIEPAGTPTFAGYDPPWTPGFLRRNEVLIPIA